jgi:hypothetical protein
MVQSRTTEVRLPMPVFEHPLECGLARAVVTAYADKHGPIPNGGHRSSRRLSVVQPDRFRTTDVRASAINA